MNTPLRLMVLAIAAVGAADRACAEWQVWTLTETRRVLRDHPLAENTHAPRSERTGQAMPVKLAAAGNEWESFQILIRSDAPVRQVDVKAGDLRGPDGAVLRAADARLFRQHQLHLAVGTYRNEGFEAGWYPDPLIPFRHPANGKPLEGARLRAVPFDLPARETHGFWVDLYVPPDTKPGEYRGTYRVGSGAGSVVEVPVVLTVWDFQLPRVSTLRTALGSPAARMRSYYRQRAADGKEEEPSDWAAPSDWDAVETQCAEMLSRHRVNATPPPGSLVPVAQDDGTFRIPTEQVGRLREFVDRYHVNALQVPRPTGVVNDPESQREKLHAWLASWDRAGAELDRPHVLFFTYLRDEPNDEDAYRFVQKWGRAIRRANSPVKVMVVEQTSSQDEAWGDLYGAVDVWCPLFCLFKPESAARRQALGESVWTYTALCQREKTPWWHIDYPLLNYRVPAWIAWRYRIRGLLYWGGMSYWSQVDDPWTDPKTYCPRGPDQSPIYNGEGTLVYPGRAVGYDGIAPSLRLKALRDSIEDYEYLAILERSGRAADAQRLILPLADSWFHWETDPAAYEKARAKLAELIVSAKE